MSTNLSAWERHNWTIVRSDLDIAHVMLPMSDFRLEGLESAAKPSYRIVHRVRAPNPDYFAGAALKQIGQEDPSFFEVTGMDLLPAYSQATIDEYIGVSEAMSSYLTENPAVKRLEGIIRIPCHDPAAPIHNESLKGHSSQTVKTLIQFYQFANAVAADGDRRLTLLVVRAPLSPACPMNGDGTAVGMGR